LAEAAKGTEAAHLGKETEAVPGEVLVGTVKDGVEEEEEEGAEREEKETIGAAALCWLVARWCEVAGPRSVVLVRFGRGWWGW